MINALVVALAASVFTKFHAFCLPYERVLLLDVDLLPRHGTDLGELFRVPAPAGKYHSARYQIPQPEHGGLIPDDLMDGHWWCPNAGVLRLDPLPTRAGREKLLAQMVKEINVSDCPTFLPEQYFLAQHFQQWRHIGDNWNYEVWFEWDVPKQSVNLMDAVKESKQQGLCWALSAGADGEQAREEALVWHFSGTVDTQPWLFLDKATAEEVRTFAAKTWYAARDPGGVLAAAVTEWREALR